MATPSNSMIQLTSLTAPATDARWTLAPTQSSGNTVMPSVTEVKHASFESSTTETKITLLSKRQINLPDIGEIPQIIWRGYAAAPATLHIPPKEPSTNYEKLREKFYIQIKEKAQWTVQTQETISEEQSRTLSICAANYFSKTDEERAICGFESHPRKGNDKKVQLFFEEDSFRICLVIERSSERGSTKRIGRSLMINLNKESPAQSAFFYRQIRIKNHPNHLSAYKSMASECETLAPLDHPNILPIFHAAMYMNSKGNKQIVMGVPCLETSLSKAIKTQKIPSFLHMAKGLASALLKCHDQRLYHADLTPANIVMDSNGEPKVIDFGNAGKDFGTLPYLPPDLVKKLVREASSPDTTVDMWSLGCILYILYITVPRPNNEHFFAGTPLFQKFFSKKIEPHMLLPWGELMQVYQRIETALSTIKKGDPQKLTEADNKTRLDLHTRRDNIFAILPKFDMSWVAPENYRAQRHYALLFWLQEIDFVLANTIYFANKGHDIGLDLLPSLLVLLEKMLQKMQMVLEVAPRLNTPELQILHATLQPQKAKRATAEQLSAALAKINVA